MSRLDTLAARGFRILGDCLGCGDEADCNEDGFCRECHEVDKLEEEAGYIVARVVGIPPSQLPLEMIWAKAAQLKLLRAARKRKR